MNDDERRLICRSRQERRLVLTRFDNEVGVLVEPRRLARIGSKTGWQPVRESRGLELEHSAALTG